MSNKVVLGLGGNEGNVSETLNKSHNMIRELIGEIDLQSSFYQTKAWGIESQPDFINQVIRVGTDLQPKEILIKCLEIEKILGRERKQKWGQRTIDIDILFYDNIIVETPDLKIPHPYIHQRNFVLYPLSEILPKFNHPTLNKTILELKNECNDSLKVIKL